MGEWGGSQRSAEKIALSFRAALNLKVRPLFLRFDALCHHQLLEAFGHINYGAHDCGVVGISGDLMDKRLVNFQDINRKLAEIAETGIASAEVVDRKAYSHPFERLKYGCRGFGVLHKDAFSELEFEISGVQTGFRECRPHTFDKTLTAELDSGNVDGNGHWRESNVLPSACLPACFAQHPTADLQN